MTALELAAAAPKVKSHALTIPDLPSVAGLVAEQTAWTSQKYDLTVQLWDARLAVRRAEVDGEQTLKQQWVRAPVAGTVADVRISEVSTRGVSLEVVLLERTETAEVSE